MKKLFKVIILLLSTTSIFAQSSDSTQTKKKYPYVFPILGQQVQDRGIDFPLPAGISLNYVFNEMYLDITQFEMSIAGKDMTDILNEQTLGFKKTRAFTNGLNLRADLFALPFMNVYGLFSRSVGGTEVSLQPQFENVTFPEFSSKVEFDAVTVGGGATFHYAYKKYFVSVDGNYSSSKSALLEQSVGLFTTSMRIGRRFSFKNKTKLAFYIGAMYRNFTNNEGNTGSVTINEALPNLDNQIEEWYNGLTAPQQRIIDRVQARIEERLSDTDYDKITDLPIAYFIKKDLIKQWTFQFGFNYELSKHWSVRGEYGVSDFSKFLLTGVNYRFGF
ncbi:porin family protein [Flammeovirga yaeyamensis]|uniref:Porin family protein n=1 Tax=Flammeovirga yaeyamensis TaxID=367791 RepID=A0AAX1NAH9_9BACT|nr:MULTISPECIES: hypothetical protein [Flammeovirga]ANQ49085.1 porin family protein [Flammeovirga sp. MY04]MBB3698052.1 hypothetical protein [Flammeovirga yaeyamensis]NMF35596.1 porin family protein [Flammeovirga yaeyamensis]QWG03446.1 porin family protein [Flammeovirga yaeyamensis]